MAGDTYEMAAKCEFKSVLNKLNILQCPLLSDEYEHDEQLHDLLFINGEMRNEFLKWLLSEVDPILKNVFSDTSQNSSSALESVFRDLGLCQSNVSSFLEGKTSIETQTEIILILIDVCLDKYSENPSTSFEQFTNNLQSNCDQKFYRELIPRCTKLEMTKLKNIKKESNMFKCENYLNDLERDKTASEKELDLLKDNILADGSAVGGVHKIIHDFSNTLTLYSKVHEYKFKPVIVSCRSNTETGLLCTQLVHPLSQTIINIENLEKIRSCYSDIHR